MSEVQVVEQVSEDSGQQEPEAPAVEVVQVEEVELEPATKRGTPINTWTLRYGNKTINLVEGREQELPADVYDYLRRTNCLKATL